MSLEIAAAAYRLPNRLVGVRELRNGYSGEIQRAQNQLQIVKLRELDLSEVGGVHVTEDEKPGDLALAAIAEVLEQDPIRASEIDFIIDYSTTSRDSNGLSLSYRIQDAIGAESALTLAIGNGSCVSLQLALRTAAAYMRDDQTLTCGLLFSEDRVKGRRLYPPFNVLGDGASAILLKRAPSMFTVLGTEYISIGRFHSVLGINHYDRDNFNYSDFESRVVPLHYKVILALTDKLLAKHNLGIHCVDLILYQNMSANDYQGLQAILGVSADRVYQNGLHNHGHIFGSDLVVNLVLAQAEKRISAGNHLLLISSGAGYSWGVTLLATRSV